MNTRPVPIVPSSTDCVASLAEGLAAPADAVPVAHTPEVPRPYTFRVRDKAIDACDRPSPWRLHHYRAATLHEAVHVARHIASLDSRLEVQVCGVGDGAICWLEGGAP